MNNYYPTPYYPQPLAPASANYVEMGKVGAVVGLCGAGAANIRRYQNGEIERNDAIVDTVRASVSAGLATAAATAVAGQFKNPALSLLATVATGTAVMYLAGAESRKTSGEDE